MSDEIQQQQDTNPAQDAEQRVPEHDEAAQVEDSAPSDDSADTAAEPEAKKAKGVQKRIDELTANWRSTERDRDYWRELAMQHLKGDGQPAQPQQAPQTQAEPAPKEEDFASYDDFLRATARWEVKQELAQERQRQQEEAKQREQQQTYQQRVQSFQQRMQTFAAEHPDFQQVALNPSVPITDAMQEAILDSDMGPQVAYHLGQHPEEAARIARMSPYAAAREIGRIEARLAIPPKPKVSQAPEPIRPVGGSGEGRSKSPDEMSISEWMAWRNKQVSNR
jgi:hypothetical protein